MQGRFERRTAPRLFLTRDAADYDVSEWALRRNGGVRSFAHGIRVDPEGRVNLRVPDWADDRWEDQSHALRALQLVHSSVAASHTSAARLYGLPLPRRCDGEVLHVATDDRDMRIRREDVVLHRVADFAEQNILGHRLVTPPVLFLQLATVLSRNELVQAGDAMIGRWHGPPICSHADLGEHLESRKRVRGRRTAEEALALVRPGVDSPPETGLRLWALEVGLPEPEVHPAVFCRSLGCELHPDLGYRRARLGLEYEGDHHRTDKRQWDDDLRRTNAFNSAGWTIIRVNSRTNRVELERSIRQRLAASGLI